MAVGAHVVQHEWQQAAGGCSGGGAVPLMHADAVGAHQMLARARPEAAAQLARTRAQDCAAWASSCCFAFRGHESVIQSSTNV